MATTLKALRLTSFSPKELKPSGWLLTQLKLQAEGLAGNLDKVWPDVRDSKWIDVYKRQLHWGAFVLSYEKFVLSLSFQHLPFQFFPEHCPPSRQLHPHCRFFDFQNFGNVLDCHVLKIKQVQDVAVFWRKRGHRLVYAVFFRNLKEL